MTDFAYTKYAILWRGGDTYTLYTETNDDGDTGYPGEFAQWSDDYRGPDALEKIKKTTGVSRQGVGHRVFVTLEGREINSEEDWPS